MYAQFKCTTALEALGESYYMGLSTAGHILEGGAKLIGTARAIYEGGRALAPLAAALI